MRSQAQWAPFNAYYSWDNATYATIYNSTATQLNAYRGSVYQQASSAISNTNQNCYEGNSACYSTYGFEYKPGYDSDGESPSLSPRRF
jgi:beta-glucan synthesis-associated protein KRE6